MPKKPSVNMNKKDKNPQGGLSQAGRDKYNRATGSNLKAPVKRTPTTPEEIRRQGSFLVRMGSSAGPLKDEKGEKTRLKLSLEAWNHKGDKASAVAKGRNLLQRYGNIKKGK
ncbi:MAG: hypothetical protein JHC33_04705 [Ignisphaera sp.]|jgi:hypothetical protein|nr:hypothetical protein [Ignisphaera sp.]